MALTTELVDELPQQELYRFDLALQVAQVAGVFLAAHVARAAMSLRLM